MKTSDIAGLHDIPGVPMEVAPVKEPTPTLDDRLGALEDQMARVVELQEDIFIILDSLTYSVCDHKPTSLKSLP